MIKNSFVNNKIYN